MNDIIINQFKLLLKQIKIELDNATGKEVVKHTFRLDSIKKVIKILENFSKEIKSIDDVKNIKGIGKGSVRRIKEILDTGKLSEVKIKDVESDYLQSIDNLIKVFGIGRKKAHELVIKHGIKTINDLKKIVKNKKIDLPENIIKGLKYVDKTKTDIPRQEIDQIFIYLVEKALFFDRDLNVIICGSYRRLKSTSNDIDVLIYHNDIMTKNQAEKSNTAKNYIKLLVKDKFIVDNYTSYDVPTKFMGLCKYNKYIRRIDIRLIPTESIYPAMLYFTGSGDFNKKMRKIAMDLGYTLNEYALINSKGEYVSVNSEKDIFDVLGMEYLPPELRY